MSLTLPKHATFKQWLQPNLKIAHLRTSIVHPAIDNCAKHLNCWRLIIPCRRIVHIKTLAERSTLQLPP